MKRLAALLLTVVLMGSILMSLDRAALWQNLRATRPGLFLAALILFVPQNLILIQRWRFIASRFTPMSFREAAEMILAGASMNIILPSKLGDLTKAVFLKRSGALDLPRATGLVVFEKILDLSSLCLLALAGIVAALATGAAPQDRSFAPLAWMAGLISAAVLAGAALLYLLPERWLAGAGGPSRLREAALRGHEVIRLLRERRTAMGWLAVSSIALWLLHLWQIWFFFLCLNARVPAAAFVPLMPLAIFAGLLPISLFGIGTRDWAVIMLFSAHHPPEILAGVGIYISLRYLVPALAGLPFLPKHLGLASESGAAHRRENV